VIRVAVVGVGAMGKNHARMYREIAEAELVAVADIHPAQAESVGRLYGVPAYYDYHELMAREHPEAVTVAVPTQLHYQIVSELLDAGCHVLVEKPVAATVDEAKQLVALAEKCGRVLMVGHIERYNQAVIELKTRLEAGELGRVFQIHARRLGPFPDRVRDTGVVLDLATHDLDVMQYVLDGSIHEIYADGGRFQHSSQEDLLTCLARFGDGRAAERIAALTVSHLDRAREGSLV